MQGITPLVDHNAIWHASDSKRLKKFLNSEESILALTEKDQHLEGTLKTNCLVALWNRHLYTIIAGAPRYLDRLFQAKLVDSDICPTCNVRGTAEHWLYQCPNNLGAVTRRKTIDDHISKVATNPYLGQHRARTLQDLYDTPCLRVCGICPAPPDNYKLQHANTEAEIQDISGLYQLAAGNSDTNPIIDTTHCVEKWITTDEQGIQRIIIYTDGSCADPRSNLSRAGWN